MIVLNGEGDRDGLDIQMMQKIRLQIMETSL